MSTPQRNNVKISALLATSALMLAALSACGSNSETSASGTSTKGGGGSGDSSYCAALSAANDKYFTGGGTTLADPEAAYGAMRLLAKQAPKAISADWEVMDEGIQTLFDVLADAGIEFDELSEIFEDNIPEGFDISRLDKLEPAISAMASPEFQAAEEKVQAHAKSECKVDFEMGPGNAE